MKEQLKRIPLASINSLSRSEDSPPEGYLHNGGYVITRGGDAVERARLANKRCIDIVELRTPIDDANRDAFVKLKRILADSKVTYQRLPVSGTEYLKCHRPQTLQRVNMISSFLRKKHFPFDGMSLLDLGCAEGYMDFSFESYGFDVTGVDRNPRRLAIARAVGDIIQGGVHFQKGDIMGFLAKSNVYDVVFTLYTFHHLIQDKHWRISQCRSFLAKLAKATSKVLIIAYPPGRIPRKNNPYVNNPTKMLRWLCADQFTSVTFLGKAHYPIWACVR